MSERALEPGPPIEWRPVWRIPAGARAKVVRIVPAQRFTDAYVKIAIVKLDIDVTVLPHPLTLESFTSLPPEHRPAVRTYTVRQVDTDRRETGLPDGAKRCVCPDAAADWHLMAGDESAVPAIGAALEALPDNGSAGCTSRSPVPTT